MKLKLMQIALVVKDYDEAINYYTEKLEFNLLEDTKLSESKRWVILGIGKASTCNLLLAKAANDEQLSRVGNQSGGRVFLFLYTQDFQKDYNTLKENGVSFVREPVLETWGMVAVFKDLYGNLWDLIEPKNYFNKNILD